MALKGQAQIFGINYLWTNTAGGDFNVAANWSPNGVPGVNDGAIIANIGNFTVHLNTSAAIAGLTLGGSTLMYGRQTLSITNPAAIFTVGGDMLIDRSGVLSFSGSAISCPSNSTVNGIFNVMSGSIGSTNAASGLVTVTTNGAWSLIGVATLYEPVANYGTVVLTNGGSLNLGRSSTFPVAFTNELNALVDIQNDQAISFASGVPNPPSTAGIYNYGLLRKSVGATNSATSIRVPFHNNGTIQPLAGDLVFSGGLSLSSSSDLQFLMAAAKPGMMTLASPAPATNSPPTLPTLGSPSSLQLAGTLEVDVNQTNGPIPNIGRPITLMTFDLKRGVFDSVVLGTVSNGSIQVQLPTYPGSVVAVIRTNASPVPPTTNMSDLTTVVGGTATFSPPAFGIVPRSYQWESNGTFLVGETNASLMINNAQTSDAANYCVTVTDALQQTNTYCATLSVVAPPVFTVQPVSQTVSNGATLFLSTTVTNPLPVSYQWRRNAVNIAGATGPTLTVTTNALAWDGGSYDVQVSMPDPQSSRPLSTIVSTEAVVTVTSPALPFGNFPGGKTNATSFIGSGTISSTNNIYLQWTAPTNYDGLMEFDTMGSSLDTVLTVGTGTNLANFVTLATNDDDSIYLASRALIHAIHNTTYVVGVGGFAGATGPVVLSGIFVTNDSIPQLDGQPQSQGVPAGGTAVFSVSATNTVNVSYQWSKGGLVKIPGATNSTLVITNVSLTDVDTYSVTITGGTNSQSVDSLRATLEIGPSLSFGKLGSLLQQYIQQSGGNGFSLVKFNGSAQSVSFPSVAAGSIDSQLMNNFASTTSPSDPTNLIASGGSPRWFILTAGTNATMKLDTQGSDLPTTFLGVYVPHGLFQVSYEQITNDVDSAPDGIHSQVYFPAASNTTYLVEVDGATGDQGTNIYLNWKMGIPPNALGTPPSDVLTQGTGLPLLAAGQSNNVTSPGYQWQCNGTNIPGATASTYQLDNYQCGSYSVVVSNLVGMVTNAVALVYVDAPLQLQLASPQPAEVRLLGSASHAAVLLLSTNLAAPVWTPLYTNSVPLLPISYLDTDSTNRNKGFYRLKPWP